MKIKKKCLNFSSKIKKQVIKRSGNRCERCGIDFDEHFVGEFHHIIPIVYNGDNSIDNCSLLCHNCHLVALNTTNKKDILIFKNYFLRFASFKEATQYFNVNSRFDLQIKIAVDIIRKVKNIL